MQAFTFNDVFFINLIILYIGNCVRSILDRDNNDDLAISNLLSKFVAKMIVAIILIPCTAYATAKFAFWLIK